MNAIEILLVEDNPSDKLLTIRALEKAKLFNNLHAVEDGVEAMAFLRQEGKFVSAPRPDLILLDLNLPKQDGRAVLNQIKADERLRLIPVVVLTSSQQDAELLGTESLQANYFIPKPVDFERFASVVRSIETFWFEVVRLPAKTVSAKRTGPGPAPRPATPSGTAKKILLIEDSPSDAFLLRAALEGLSEPIFAVTHVESVQAGMSALAETSFDVVLTDLGLPDTSGLETFRQVRDAATGVPVIVLTALADENVGVNALQEGAQDYLVKGELDGKALRRALLYAIERNRLEGQLRESQRLDAVGRLAEGIAHDFNNLLTVISGYAQILGSNTSLADTEAARVGMIREAADRASSLTRQLLTFSRKDAVRSRLLDLNEVIGKSQKLLASLLGSHVRLELRFGRQLPLVWADEGMIDQVLMNLAINARDAMLNGGKLAIATTTVNFDKGDTVRPPARAGEFVSIQFSDTGDGIPAAVLPHIFEPFFTTKSVGKGSGLGLATVSSIVQQHSGWIDVESSISAGTTFKIFLPAAAAPQPAPVPEALPEKLESTEEVEGTGTILFAEDEPTLRQLTAMFLESYGYRVLEATNGAEAEAIYQHHQKDICLLLTDMVMPEMNGSDLAKAVRSIRPELPVIYVSGYSPDILKDPANFREGVNFLTKPYDLQRLLKLIRQQLKGARES